MLWIIDSIKWILKYFLGDIVYYIPGFKPEETGEQSVLREEEATEFAIHETGEEVINVIYSCVLYRMPALIVGTRGGGKSYCTENAIRKGMDEGIIIHWYFIQGNTQIPREYLSEDIIVIKDKEINTLPAIAMCSPREFTAANFPAFDKAQKMGIDEIEYRQLEKEVKQKGKAKIPPPVKPNGSQMRAMGIDPKAQRRIEQNWDKIIEQWPAVPCELIELDVLKKLWRNCDWQVLFLDEVNRFGSGFLDSLLSLTEEQKIVRRGEQFFVPLLVLSTQNPPGYDITAQRLSPPLEARQVVRITILNPGQQTLAETIIPPKLLGIYAQLTNEAIESSRDKVQAYYHPDNLLEQAYLVSACVLCMWGDPGSKLKGLSYLLPETFTQLKAAMDIAPPSFRQAMRTLSTLIEFGPDARAGVHWLMNAIIAAYGEGQLDEVDNNELLHTCLMVLGHKTRDSFNEGPEPGKKRLKEHCLKVIVENILTNELLRNFFLSHLYTIRALARKDKLTLQEVQEFSKIVKDRFSELAPERRKNWYQALCKFPKSLELESFDTWKKEAEKEGALFKVNKKKSFFYNRVEQLWLAKVFEEIFAVQQRYIILQAQEIFATKNGISEEKFVSQFKEILTANNGLWDEKLASSLTAIFKKNDGKCSERFVHQLGELLSDNNGLLRKLVAELRNEEIWDYKSNYSLSHLFPAQSILKNLTHIFEKVCADYGLDILRSKDDVQIWLKCVGDFIAPRIMDIIHKDILLWNAHKDLSVRTIQFIPRKIKDNPIHYPETIRDPEKTYFLLQKTFQKISPEFNLVGRKRCRIILRRLEILRAIEKKIEHFIADVCRYSGQSRKKHDREIFRKGLEILLNKLHKKEISNAAEILDTGLTLLCAVFAEVYQSPACKKKTVAESTEEKRDETRTAMNCSLVFFNSDEEVGKVFDICAEIIISFREEKASATIVMIKKLIEYLSGECREDREKILLTKFIATMAQKIKNRKNKKQLKEEQRKILDEITKLP